MTAHFNVNRTVGAGTLVALLFAPVLQTVEYLVAASLAAVVASWGDRACHPLGLLAAVAYNRHSDVAGRA